MAYLRDNTSRPSGNAGPEEIIVRSYTRHQLKQDQFTEAAKGTFHWAGEHRQKLLFGSIAAAVALALGLGIWFYLGYRETRAADALGRAMLIYGAPLTGTEPTSVGPSFATNAERNKAAHAEFAKVANEFSGVRSGKLARYFSGATALEEGNTTDAERDLKMVADSSDPDISSLAKLALAGLYRGSNRQAEAVKLYNQIIQKPSRSVPKEAAQLELASLFGISQPDEARKLYAQIKQENPKGAAGQIAEIRLQLLK
ncbi:MAG TPA: tetratricopeptide repeat protein [Terriglobales bacterium]|jgi:predicted negative regulator of RcsB-dependent stress response|nr:tetratricopeptide repeat protein [Terriglobales bacterium]